MRKVERDELLALGPYESVRPHFRQRVIDLKNTRRMVLGDHMSLVFENHDTVLLQIQEMLRTERITDERAIAHELQTYNELIAGPDELSGTLFIEYDDPEERRPMLRRFASLRDQVFFAIGDLRAQATFSKHFGEELDLLPAVNYLKFPLGGALARALSEDLETPARVVITHPEYPVDAELPRPTRNALRADLAS